MNNDSRQPTDPENNLAQSFLECGQQAFAADGGSSGPGSPAPVAGLPGMAGNAAPPGMAGHAPAPASVGTDPDGIEAALVATIGTAASVLHGWAEGHSRQAGVDLGRSLEAARIRPEKVKELATLWAVVARRHGVAMRYAPEVAAILATAGAGMPYLLIAQECKAIRLHRAKQAAQQAQASKANEPTPQAV